MRDDTNDSTRNSDSGDNASAGIDASGSSASDVSGVTIRDSGTRTRSRGVGSAGGTSREQGSDSGSDSGRGSVVGSISSNAEPAGRAEVRSSSIGGGGGSGSDSTGAGEAGVSDSSSGGHSSATGSGEVKKRRRRRRDAEGNLVPLDENDDRPTAVPLSRLGAGEDSVIDSKGLIEDALGFVADALFDLLPRFFVPKPALSVWPLDDDEKDALVKRGKALVMRMDKRNKAALMKRLDKWVPPIALGVTAIALIQPRIQQTNEIVAAIKRANVTDTTTQENGRGIAAAPVTAPPANLGIVRPSDGGNGRARTNPLDSTETI